MRKTTDSIRESFSDIATGTNAGATATIDAITGKTLVCTFVGGRVDATSIIKVLSGATTIYETTTGAGGFHLEFHGDLTATTGEALSAQLVSSTATCSITIGGGRID
jgi:hypothetical protein